MATALLLFSPLPSTSFIHRNPNPIPVSPLRGFPPFSISVRRVTRRSAVTSVCAVASTASPVDHLDISKLGISEQIVSALSRRGITELFPIQRAVLEPAMEGRDMIGRAITGSGKTLAFGIPILDKIIRHQSQSRKKKIPSALVLAPTRELARQVQREFKESAPNLSSTCLYGGIPITDQVRALKFGIDIAVGTPGRIIDLVERGALNLSEVRFVVLDEADQMLAIGFQEDVECILSYLPVKKQSMLFSATMPSWVNELSRKFLKDPLVIDLVCKSEKKLAEGISLYSIPSAASGKQTLLPILISQYAHGGKTIIFTKTRNDAEELSRSMGSIIGSKALHGNMQQSSRDRTIAAFRSGRFDVLVATDVAARGLDIPDVDLVIHFEMPNTSEIFIHRSGRTGRAGKKGTTVLMFTENQRRDVRAIERDLRCKFEELPRNENGGGNRTGLTHRRGSSSEGYNLQQRRQDHSSSMRFGSEGRYQGSYANSNSKKSHSNTSKFSEGNSGYQRFRKSGFSSVPGTGQSKYVHSDRSQRVQYDSFMDFDDNYLSENGAGISGSRFAKSPSRSRSAKNQPRIRRNSSDSIFNDDFDFPEDKRRQSKSKHESFEQILDLFKDNY